MISRRVDGDVIVRIVKSDGTAVRGLTENEYDKLDALISGEESQKVVNQHIPFDPHRNV